MPPRPPRALTLAAALAAALAASAAATASPAWAQASDACCEKERSAPAPGDAAAAMGTPGWVAAGSRWLSCPEGGVMTLSTASCTCSSGPQRCPEGAAHAQAGWEPKSFTVRCAPAAARRAPAAVELRRVNDNYCDCGTDEPDTSACSGWSLAQAASEAEKPVSFVCGARDAVTVLAPSRVGDGVVDCCDGRDEPDARADPDGCRALVEERRRARAKKASVLAAGLAKLAEVEAQVRARISEKRAEKDKACSPGAAPSAEELNRLRGVKEAEEKLERDEHDRMRSVEGRLFKALALSPAELADVTAKLVVARGADKTREFVEQMRLAGVEGPDARDAGELAAELCPAAPAAPAAPAGAEGGAPPPPPPPPGSEPKSHRDLVAALGLERASVVDLWAHALSAGHRKVLEALPEKQSAEIAAAAAELDAPPPRPGAKEARETLDRAVAQQSEAQGRCSSLTAELGMDLGVNSTLLHLMGKELSVRSGEFTYTVKGLETVRQGHTLVGKFESWSKVASQKEVPQELDEGVDYPKPALKLSYPNGERCWNGPVRSGTVFARCGDADEVLKVVEPEMCRYVMLMQTPVACAVSADGDLAAEAADAAQGGFFSRVLGRFGLR